MRTGIRKAPRSSVKASNCVPVASWTARTATPGRTAAVESLTVPVMVASWANPVAGSARQDSTNSTNGRTSPRPIGDLLPQAVGPPILFVGVAEDDVRGLVSFPYRALPLLFDHLTAVVDAQFPRPCVDVRIFDCRDVDDVIRRGRGPAFGHVQRVGVEVADDREPCLPVVVGDVHDQRVAL